MEKLIHFSEHVLTEIITKISVCLSFYVFFCKDGLNFSLLSSNVLNIINALIHANVDIQYVKKFMLITVITFGNLSQPSKITT